MGCWISTLGRDEELGYSILCINVKLFLQQNTYGRRRANTMQQLPPGIALAKKPLMAIFYERLSKERATGQLMK